MIFAPSLLYFCIIPTLDLYMHFRPLLAITPHLMQSNRTKLLSLRILYSFKVIIGILKKKVGKGTLSDML